MADQTVTEHPLEFGHDQALAALRKTGQAMAILQVMWVAIEAGEDGCVNFSGLGGPARWQPSADAVVQCVQAVRDAIIESVRSPDGLDWWTPLNLAEALAAALWAMESGVCKDRLDAEQVQAMADVVMESLAGLYEALGIELERLKLDASTVATES